MSVGSSRGVWKQLDGLIRFGASGQLGDAELIGRFVTGGRDATAEAAFAALVERHGPMVLGVCRRVLGDRHAAEDAFQATFLVLAQKAGAIARREQLANWLHGVASRTARDARVRANRRLARELRVAVSEINTAGPVDRSEQLELRETLDEELARLPARYRAAVILCELDGLSRQTAARRLGIAEGTLSSRLARAKDLLRHRLTRRGVSPSIVAIETAARHARVVLLPPPLAGSTIAAATRVAAGLSLAEAVSVSVLSLTQGALSAMFVAKIKGIALGLAAAVVVTTGAGVLAQQPGPLQRPPASGEDRLGAVEKKLDRILEALGSRQGVLNVHYTTPPPGGQAAGAAPAPPTAPPPAAVPTAHPPVAPPPVTTGATAPLGFQYVAVKQGEGQPNLIYTQPISPMGSHVANLEQRVNELERRLAAIEQRLAAGSSTQGDRQQLGQQGNGGNQPGNFNYSYTVPILPTLDGNPKNSQPNSPMSAYATGVKAGDIQTYLLYSPYQFGQPAQNPGNASAPSQNQKDKDKAPANSQGKSGGQPGNGQNANAQNPSRANSANPQGINAPGQQGANPGNPQGANSPQGQANPYVPKGSDQPSSGQNPANSPRDGLSFQTFRHVPWDPDRSNRATPEQPTAPAGFV